MEGDRDLIWETLSREKILHTPVFDVWKQRARDAEGFEGDYMRIAAPDWVVIVPVVEDRFVLVRQWRHGEGRITLEFPGGVADPGEDLRETALRELEEETGYRAGRMTFLGNVSSNTALFENHFSVYLAEDLVRVRMSGPGGEESAQAGFSCEDGEESAQAGPLLPDKDERIRCEELPIDQVIRRYGDEELTHAYMGTALAFYLRHIAG